MLHIWSPASDVTFGGCRQLGQGVSLGEVGLCECVLGKYVLWLSFLSLSLVPAHQEEKTHTYSCTMFPYHSEQTLAGAPATHSATMMFCCNEQDQVNMVWGL